MPTDTNHITDLGNYASLDAVWVAHPEGGRPGDYLRIYGTEYHWDSVSRQWVTENGGSGTPSSTVDELSAAVNTLRTAVSQLQTAVAGKANTGLDGRAANPTRVTMKWMGATLDGTTVTQYQNGDIWFDEDEGDVKTLVDNTVKSLDGPDPGLVYCSQITGKLYRWNGLFGWERVGNDVTDNLESNKGDSGLSARMGKQLNIAINNLASSVVDLTAKVNSSIIGDRASSRVVIDVMDYTPSAGQGGTNVSPTPGGGYSPIDNIHGITAPSDMTGDWSLRYAPSTQKLYYFYKVTDGELTQTRCSIIDPDPQMIYWDASDPDNERVMRWDAANKVWIYNSTYATVSAMTAALSEKADIADVYTKAELDAAFDAAENAEDISGAISAIEGALQAEETGGNTEPAEQNNP